MAYPRRQLFKALLGYRGNNPRRMKVPHRRAPHRCRRHQAPLKQWPGQGDGLPPQAIMQGALGLQGQQPAAHKEDASQAGPPQEQEKLKPPRNGEYNSNSRS
jgi:hypothetical protein